MSTNRAIPQVPSLGPVTLFRFGPWEVIVPFLLVAAVATIAWISSPAARVAFVVDWRFAGAAGAALGGMIGVAAFTRIWWDIRHGLPFIFLSAAAGFAALAVASQTIFTPALVRASQCAPLLAAAMPPATRVASYVLPVLLFVAWTIYLLSRFPVIETMDHVTPSGAESRYGRYAHAIQRVLPFRVAALVIAIGASVFFLLRIYTPPPSNAPAQMLKWLEQPAFALLDLERGAPTFAALAAARAAAEQRATLLLQDLDLDEAAPAVRECTCQWLTPRDRVAPHIAEAAAGFAVLDRELAPQRWRPTAVTTAALLQIIPLGEGEELPLFAQQWITTDEIRRRASFERSDVDTTYRGVTVMRTRRTYAREAGSRRLVSVAIEFLGRGATDRALLAAIEKKMERAPDDGPCVIGRDSLCASWNVDQLRLRVGPAVTADTRRAEVNDETPLWVMLSAVDAPCCAVRSRD